jgi:hypothetical protein
MIFKNFLMNFKQVPFATVRVLTSHVFIQSQCTVLVGVNFTKDSLPVSVMSAIYFMFRNSNRLSLHVTLKH